MSTPGKLRFALKAPSYFQSHSMSAWCRDKDLGAWQLSGLWLVDSVDIYTRTNRPQEWFTTRVRHWLTSFFFFFIIISVWEFGSDVQNIQHLISKNLVILNYVDIIILEEVIAKESFHEVLFKKTLLWKNYLSQCPAQYTTKLIRNQENKIETKTTFYLKEK